MRYHNHSAKHLRLPCILGALLLCGCVEEKISYSRDTGEEGPDTLSGGRVRVDFDAAVGSYATRAGFRPIGTDRYATVYAFDGAQPAASVKYISKETGSLTPLKSPMYLPTGRYRLYAAGINTPHTAIPLFTDGVCSGLKNNVDYLWWGVGDVIPEAPVTNYTVDFAHCCTQVVLNLMIQNTITVDSIHYVALTPSAMGNIDWNLYEGTIGPADAVDENAEKLSYTRVNDSTYAAQLMTAPLRVPRAADLTATFEIRINGELEPRTYHAPLPVYRNDLLAGYSYRYDLLVKTDTVEFLTVDIIDWVDIDADLKPIIPTESE